LEALEAAWTCPNPVTGRRRQHRAVFATSEVKVAAARKSALPGQELAAFLGAEKVKQKKSTKNCRRYLPLSISRQKPFLCRTTDAWALEKQRQKIAAIPI
jgi:hypothetical protein